MYCVWYSILSFKVFAILLAILVNCVHFYAVYFFNRISRILIWSSWYLIEFLRFQLEIHVLLQNSICKSILIRFQQEGSEDYCLLILLLSPPIYWLLTCSGIGYLKCCAWLDWSNVSIIVLPTLKIYITILTACLYDRQSV